MPKITIRLPTFTGAKQRGHLMEATEGAAEALEILSTIDGIGLSGHVEVIIIELASWAPVYDHLYIQIVLNNEGKKTEEYVVQDPSEVEIRSWIHSWIREKLEKYLAVEVAKSRSGVLKFQEKLERLKFFTPIPAAK